MKALNDEPKLKVPVSQGPNPQESAITEEHSKNDIKNNMYFDWLVDEVRAGNIKKFYSD